MMAVLTRMEEKQVLLSIITPIIACIVHLNPFSHYWRWISCETHRGGEIQPHTFRPRPDCMTHFCECYRNFNIQGHRTPSFRVLLAEQICVCGMTFSDLT